jgi:two-component system LytT family response regulator
VLDEELVDKYAIPVYDGLAYVDFSSILYLEANHDKTIFYLIDNRSVRSTKTIGCIEKTLTGKPFFRIHDKYMINLFHIENYYRGCNRINGSKSTDSGCVVLSSGQSLPVSVGKKEKFLQHFRY